ncbi:hypothetical protein THIOKS1860013 [Thiocapsa sp. KS1]|nr:hypothetical protein THIOKS1860013 [Thiocapsa sp. KS1]
MPRQSPKFFQLRREITQAVRLLDVDVGDLMERSTGARLSIDEGRQLLGDRASVLVAFRTADEGDDFIRVAHGLAPREWHPGSSSRPPSGSRQRRSRSAIKRRA